MTIGESEYPGEMELESERQARVERAVEADLRNYRTRQILKVVVAAVLAVIGGYLGVITSQDLLTELLRKLGAKVPGVLRSLGPYIFLGCSIWIVQALNALSAGSLRRRAEQTRRLLKR